jgi:predicted ATPase
MLPRITGVQEISIAYLLLTNGLGCYDFPGRVCSAESKGEESPEAGLLDSAQNYATTLNRIRNNLNRLEDWKEIVGALRRLNDKIVSVDMNAQYGNRLIVGHRMADDKVFTLDIANESEGFRRFLAHLLALYQTPPKQTLIFEEPEKGIHPGALETLAEELKAAPVDGRGQVILTTHSPALLDQFDPESIRVAEMKEHVTKIGKLVPEQLDSLKEELLRPGELFTVDPARMAELAVPPSKVAEE